MDIKLKKTHKKLKVIIILLTIIVPAIVLVALYPRMGRIANEHIDKQSYTDYEYFVSEDFVKDAVSFLSEEYATIAYKRGSLTDEQFYSIGKEVKERSERLKQSNTMYKYVYTYGAEVEEVCNIIDNEDVEMLLNYVFDGGVTYIPETELERASISSCYVVEFGVYGSKESNNLLTVDGIYHTFDLDSASQAGLLPKNIKAVFFMPSESEYIDTVEYHYGAERDNAYFEIGALVPMFAMIGIVAFVAVILPFFKGLNIGNEKIFRMPGEIAICIGGIVAFAMTGMFYLMSHTDFNFLTNYFEVNGNIEILGYTISTKTIYFILMFINFVAWTVCFFIEYIVITIIRQFVTHPVKFVKERFIIINTARKLYKWLKFRVIKLYGNTVDIIKSLHTNKLLVLVLVVNFIVAVFAIACDFYIGVPVFLVYTLVAYILVYKKYQKVCNQFEEVKTTVEKMAEGNLKIKIEEDLGVFQPIGDELGKIKSSFEKALIEEAKSKDMKSELITNVSHDLKTPLTAIITYVDLLKKEGLSEEERQQYINTLDIKSQRLKVLIEDLFEISKANSGNVSLNIMDVDIVDLIKQVRLELEDRINESNINFKWNLPDEKIILSLDGQKTYRIFANLISNIVKYSLAGSRAYVEVVDNENKVVITFKNVSESEISCDVENLTERFVRGDASRNSEGSGLGLAIVKSFVELQGGKFNIAVDGDLFKATIQWEK